MTPEKFLVLSGVLFWATAITVSWYFLTRRFRLGFVVWLGAFLCATLSAIRLYFKSSLDPIVTTLLDILKQP